MTHMKRMAITAGFLAVTAGALFWLARPRAAAVPAATLAPAPDNPVHEIASLEATLKENPKHLPILLRLAELEHRTGKAKEAVRHLREAVAVEPRNAEAHLELAQLPQLA